jgi:hypothetical protein
VEYLGEDLRWAKGGIKCGTYIPIDMSDADLVLMFRDFWYQEPAPWREIARQLGEEEDAQDRA